MCTCLPKCLCVLLSWGNEIDSSSVQLYETVSLCLTVQFSIFSLFSVYPHPHPQPPPQSMINSSSHPCSLCFPSLSVSLEEHCFMMLAPFFSADCWNWLRPNCLQLVLLLLLSEREHFSHRTSRLKSSMFLYLFLQSLRMQKQPLGIISTYTGSTSVHQNVKTPEEGLITSYKPQHNTDIYTYILYSISTLHLYLSAVFLDNLKVFLPRKICSMRKQTHLHCSWIKK